MIAALLTLPHPVLILAALAALDGLTTHTALAGGGRELNPLPAALFAVHPAFGEAVRVSAWLGVLSFLTYVHRRAPRSLWLEPVEIAMICVSGVVVWANLVQLVAL